MSGLGAASKLSRAAWRKALERTKPPTASASMVHIAAAAIRRAASELSRMLVAKGGIFQCVSQAAHGLDQAGTEFLAQPAHEHFDGVGVAVEILVIEMLDQLGARHH